MGWSWPGHFGHRNFQSSNNAFFAQVDADSRCGAAAMLARRLLSISCSQLTYAADYQYYAARVFLLVDHHRESASPATSYRHGARWRSRLDREQVFFFILRARDAASSPILLMPARHFSMYRFRICRCFMPPRAPAARTLQPAPARLADHDCTARYSPTSRESTTSPVVLVSPQPVIHAAAATGNNAGALMRTAHARFY